MGRFPSTSSSPRRRLCPWLPPARMPGAGECLVSVRREMLMTRPRLRMLPLPPCFLWVTPVWATLALAMLVLATLVWVITVLPTTVWATLVWAIMVLDTQVLDTPVSDTLVWDTPVSLVFLTPPSPPPPRLSRRSPSTSSSPGDVCVPDPGLVLGVDCA